MILLMIFYSLIAFKFCSGEYQPSLSNDLVRNYAHWFVYLACMGFFLAIMYVTIYSYQKMVKIMIEKINLQYEELKQKNEELRNASENIKVLKGLLPICSSCKKIRDDKGYWNQIEEYIDKNSEASFSHGICPDCLKKLYPEFVSDD
ncbi:hypothetical protein [Desulfobacter latus]|uniref:Uncharacterized protein n=1 Tax=Desulfobacter latus TaxID=2292 RepID=A0A850SYF8_9BACT|nr:hypothetical protein [Desulfobacter latus]NWH06239.1 hypothetical protein [Desulfobacter latus]